MSFFGGDKRECFSSLLPIHLGQFKNSYTGQLRPEPLKESFSLGWISVTNYNHSFYSPWKVKLDLFWHANKMLILTKTWFLPDNSLHFILLFFRASQNTNPWFWFVHFIRAWLQFPSEIITWNDQDLPLCLPVPDRLDWYLAFTSGMLCCRVGRRKQTFDRERRWQQPTEHLSCRHWWAKNPDGWSQAPQLSL